MTQGLRITDQILQTVKTLKECPATIEYFQFEGNHSIKNLSPHHDESIEPG